MVVIFSVIDEVLMWSESLSGTGFDCAFLRRCTYMRRNDERVFRLPAYDAAADRGDLSGEGTER